MTIYTPLFFRVLMFVIFTNLLSINIIAQSKYSVSSKFLLKDTKPYIQNGIIKGEIPQNIINLHAINQIDGKYYAGALIQVDLENFNESALENLGAFITSRANHILSIQCPLEKAERLAGIQGIIHIDMDASDSPVVDLAATDTQVDCVHAGVNLPFGYTGKNVVVGVIDWGYDYAHPNYYDADENYKVAKAWDQNKVGGTAPTGYNYGSAYETEAAALAAEHDDPYVFGLGSHGTHTSGIAAGSGAGTKYKGIAHDAELVLISYRRSAASLLDAMTYVQSYANSVYKPFVFNMSTGSHTGPHDGTSLKNQAITQIVGSGKVFVGSAGNNGDNLFHLKHVFGLPNDTISTVVQFGPYNLIDDMFGQSVVLWGTPNTPFSMAFSIVTSNRDTLWTSPYYNSANEPSVDSMFMFMNDTIHYKLESIAQDPNNNKPNIRFDIKNKTNFNIVVHLTAPNGYLHAWNVVRLNQRVTNWGYAFRNRFGNNPIISGYVAGDNEYGVGEPSGVGPDVITVGAYNREVLLPNGQTSGGSIASFTSFGPTVDGRVKPDITAPGVQVVSAVSNHDSDPGATVTTVDFRGETFRFERYSGTSMSGPVVAGIVALMLDVNPTLFHHEIRQIIRNTAHTDNFTGTIPPEGITRWGWGKIRALPAVIQALNQVNVKNVFHDGQVKLYPNPVNNQLTINIIDMDLKSAQLDIFDLSGRKIYSKNINHSGINYVENINIDFLSKGIYMVNISENNQIINSSKLVKN
jgi:minor extracellular serine protease Vpr